MPTRMLRDWTDSDRLEGISAEAERVFVRLLMKADDYGRFHAEPRRLKAALFPLLETIRANDLVRWLDELSRRRLILCYEVENRQLLAIPRFGQRLRQSRAKFPPPDGESPEWMPPDDDCPRPSGSGGKLSATSGESPPDSDLDLDNEVDTPKPPKGASSKSKFDQFWERYPPARRDGREKCRKLWNAKKLDAIADEVIAGLERWIASDDWTKEDGKFLKGTIAWLNSGKWEAMPIPAVRVDDDTFGIVDPSGDEIRAELARTGAE